MIKKVLFSLILSLLHFNVNAQLADCSSIFWSLEQNGNIRHWNLNNGTITGGTVEAIVPNTASAVGLAYCNNGGDNTFFVPMYGTNTVKKYLGNDTWQDIDLGSALGSNGGYGSNQYFMYANTLLYYNGSSLTEVATLPDGFNFKVADVAVDTGGRAWVFVGSGGGGITSALNVYDQNGLVISYPSTLDTYGVGSSFFLNDILYLGVTSSGRPAIRNTLTSILFNNGVVEFGTSIPFICDCSDMASCNSNTLATVPFSEAAAVQIYPNPTKDAIHIQSSKTITALALYSLTGALLQSAKGNDIDLTAFAGGLYLLKIMTADGVISKLIKKE